ncbi:MAG TPA: hypothetical protein QF644_01565, partial [Candidatus Poseidoniaceae archaeon]|nr:hypothetical protein [Candidatus Poseidoniaceae archaeon]
MKVVSNRHVLLIFSIFFFSCFIASVNANDSDGDGILDSNDDCPYSNGNSTSDRIGCPDRDGDGTSDYNDFWTAPQGDFSVIEEIIWPQSDGDIESVDFSPDGKYIVVGDDSGTLYIYETSTRSLVLTDIEVEDRPIYEVEWSPDGDKILAGNSFEEIFVYDASNIDSSSAILL